MGNYPRRRILRERERETPSGLVLYGGWGESPPRMSRFCADHRTEKRSEKGELVLKFGNGGSRPGTHPPTPGAPAGPTQTAGNPAGQPHATCCSTSGVAVQNRFYVQMRPAMAEMTSFLRIT